MGKLANYQPGKTTILLVESGDKALMDECKMLEAIREVYPAGLPAGVDQVWYANTSITGNITFSEFTLALREDQEDMAVFEARAAEPTLSYEELLTDLKAHGKLCAIKQLVPDDLHCIAKRDGGRILE